MPPSHALEQPPFGISEDVFESGARLYTRNCASCHGSPGHDAPFAKTLNPAPTQLWTRRSPSISIPPGETYARIRNGIPRSAMPSYQHTLTSTQIWQITLLLKNADQPLPDPVRALLTQTP